MTSETEAAYTAPESSVCSGFQFGIFMRLHSVGMRGSLSMYLFTFFALSYYFLFFYVWLLFLRRLLFSLFFSFL